jgi:hypothetical protein
VQGGVAPSPSMQQPLAVEMNPMNDKPTNSPASCENDILFRHGSLLPKITNPRSSRPSVDLFGKILAPITNHTCSKGLTSLLIRLLVDRKNKEDLIESP